MRDNNVTVTEGTLQLVTFKKGAGLFMVGELIRQGLNPVVRPTLSID